MFRETEGCFATFDEVLYGALSLDLVYSTVNASRANASMGRRRVATGYMMARLRGLHRISEWIHRMLSRARR